jgi:hypothetical protein
MACRIGDERGPLTPAHRPLLAVPARPLDLRGTNHAERMAVIAEVNRDRE